MHITIIKKVDKGMFAMMLMKNNKNKAFLLMITAAFCFANMNLCSRLVVGVESIEKAFFRNLFALLISAFFIIRNKTPIRLVRGSAPLMALRSVGGTLGVVFNFYAIDHTLFSNANMLNKVSPFAAIFFSTILYKERVKLPQILCLLAAFGGALFILKPGGDMINIASVIGLIGGICAGLSQSALRGLKKKGNDSMVIVFIFSLCSALMILPFALLHYTPLSLRQLFLLFLTAVFGAGGQFSLTSAYSIAPAREISIYDYTQIVFAGIFGYVFFRQIPDWLSIIGYLVIFAAAYCMFQYARRHSAEDERTPNCV